MPCLAASTHAGIQIHASLCHSFLSLAVYCVTLLSNPLVFIGTIDPFNSIADTDSDSNDDDNLLPRLFIRGGFIWNAFKESIQLKSHCVINGT